MQKQKWLSLLMVVVLLSGILVLAACTEKYTITFMADGKEVAKVRVAEGGEVVYPSLPAKAGYFGEWDIKSIPAASKDLTVTAVYAKAGELVFDSSEELLYAEYFNIDYYIGGYALITIFDSDKKEEVKLFTVPEGMVVPANVPEEAMILQLPLTNMCVSSAPVMSLINAIGGVGQVAMTTKDTSTWYIDEVNSALEDKSMVVIGSYKAPEYETLISKRPSLTVWSTMLKGVPEVVEQLDTLNINYIYDESTNETHPLGRTEWIKVYGVLMGKEAEAQAAFAEQVDSVETIIENLKGKTQVDKKTVAVCYVTSTGKYYLRNHDDYISAMIEMAGGINVDVEGQGNKGSNSTEVTPELFYALVKDVDIIIYNFSLGGKPESLEDIQERLLELSSMSAYPDNVWCTSPKFYQVTDKMGSMAMDLYNVMYNSEAGDNLEYIYKLKSGK